jgi:DNA-binding beta-propeller fold protein YncE
LVLVHSYWLAAVLTLALACTGSVWGQGLSLGYPKRIAEGFPGEVIVSDPSLGGIAALDKRTLEVVCSYSVVGEPLGVAQWRNRLFVGNGATHSVEVYRVTRGCGKMNFLYSLGDPQAGQAGFIQTPAGLAIDSQQQLVFVLDSGERTVKAFDVKGNFLYTLPAAGEVPPLSPMAIAVDEGRQQVLISDYGDPGGSFFSGPAAPAQVLIYSQAGTYFGKIDGAGRFGRPQGLAVDDLGRIYMAESLLGQVFVIDRSTGNVVNKLGSFGQAPGQLQLPLDVVLDQKSGDVFVTNNMLGRVEVFRGAGRLP